MDHTLLTAVSDADVADARAIAYAAVEMAMRSQESPWEYTHQMLVDTILSTARARLEEHMMTRHRRPATRPGRPAPTGPVISDDDWDDIDYARGVFDGEDEDEYEQAHETLERIVSGETGMHDDIRQELALAEWAAVEWSGEDFDPARVVEEIDRVLRLYPRS